MKTKNLMMKRLCYWAVVAFVLASCGKTDFSTIETGRPYVGQYQGKACAVIFDDTSEGNVSGRVYLDEGVEEAKPIMFTSELNSKGRGSLWADGMEMPLKNVSFEVGRVQGRVNDNAFSFSIEGDADLQFKPLYKEPCYEVAKEQGRVYAKDVEGYWITYPDTKEDFADIYLNKVSSLASTKKYKLDMDLYYPKDTVSRQRPLLLLIHGGAFYNGDKQALGYPEMGNYFAERGYVVASINYRLGFLPMAGDVDRAGYRALQDAHAAVCYLIENAEEFGIDTTMIFAAGTSAGAITALNLALMSEENRPETTREGGIKGWVTEKGKRLIGWVDKGVSFVGNLFNRDWGIDADQICKKLGLDSDLGPINAVAGDMDRPFRIKAVVNMWGAVHDLAMLKNSLETSILSFHGDEDPIVPYAYGYPFAEVLEPYVDNIIEGLPSFMQDVTDMLRDWVTEGKPVNEWAFSPMQGSKAIHDKASSTPGRRGRSELHTLEGAYSHSLHVERGMLTDYFYDTIMPTTSRFLYEEIMGGKTLRLVQDGVWIEALDADNVAELHWEVEGGAVVRRQGDHKAKVMFFGDARKHSVSVCGRYKNGVEFRETLE